MLKLSSAADNEHGGKHPFFSSLNGCGNGSIGLMRASGLAGRDSEMHVARARLASLAEGRGGALVVVGEPGVGKTRLVAEVLALAQEAGVARGRVACLPLVTPLPFEPVLSLFRTLSQHGRLGAQKTTFGGDPFGESLALLEEACSKGPVVLAVDDLHWSDRATLDLLHYCAARLAEIPLLWLFASRQVPAVDELCHHLCHQGLCERLELAPLTEGELAELMRSRLGEDVSGPFARAVYARSGGNPFLAEQLLHAVAVTASLSQLSRDEDEAHIRRSLAEVVPTTIIRSVADRARLLGPAAREVLTWAAVLPEPLEPAWLAPLAGTEEQVREQLCELGRALLMEQGGDGRWQFRHSLIRDATYKSVEEGERFRRHCVAAELLSAAGAPVAAVAPHLAAAGRHADAAQAYQALGYEALARSGSEDALGLFDKAAYHANQANERALVLGAEAGRALALLKLGQADAARAIAEPLRAQLRAQDDAGARLMFLSRYALALEEYASDLDDAVAVVEEMEPLLARLQAERDGLGALGPTEASSGQDLAEALLARAYVLSMAGRAAEAVPCAEKALAIARSQRDNALMVRSLNRLGLAVGLARGNAEATELLQQAVSLARTSNLRSEHALACLNLSYFADTLDDPAGQEHWARVGLEVGGAPPAVEVLLQGNVAAALMEQGDLEGALSYYRAAQATAARVGPKAEERAMISTCFALVRRGDLAEASELLNKTSPAQGSFEYYRYVDVQAQLAEEQGRDEGALVAYLQAGSAPDHPIAVWSLMCAVRAACRLGDPVRARAAFMQLEGLASRWDRAGLLRATAKAWLDLAEGKAEQAASSFAELAQRWTSKWHAAACQLQAACLTGKREGFAAAIDAYEAMGAKRAADNARRSARAAGFRPGHQPRSASPLTKREREVALLVASGMSNQEVARALYLSPRTVERHVGNMLAKLGYRSRAKLAAEVSAGRLLG